MRNDLADCKSSAAVVFENGAALALSAATRRFAEPTTSTQSGFHRSIGMSTTSLLQRLVEIERALQHKNYLAARTLVMQAEDWVLQSEREMLHVQAEKVRVAA